MTGNSAASQKPGRVAKTGFMTARESALQSVTCHLYAKMSTLRDLAWSYPLLELAMSANNNDHHTAHAEEDVVESIVHKMPVVLPIAGAILMFLLAFIAVFMA